jgi:predicted nucleic acid-binding protein
MESTPISVKCAAMTISIDTNIIAGLWNDNDPFNAVALQILHRAARRNDLVIAGPVYSELMAGPLRTVQALDGFLHETGILVDWVLDESVWREAGRAFHGYAQRLRSSGQGHPRRILADFVIGAHAQVRGYSLLTTDEKHYEAAFPKLKIFSN